MLVNRLAPQSEGSPDVGQQPKNLMSPLLIQIIHLIALKIRDSLEDLLKHRYRERGAH